MAQIDSTDDANVGHADLSQQIRDLREEIAKVASSFIERVQNSSEVGQAADTAKRVKSYVSDQSQAALDGISIEVQRQPLMALGVAAAAGALIGLLVRTR